MRALEAEAPAGLGQQLNILMVELNLKHLLSGSCVNDTTRLRIMLSFPLLEAHVRSAFASFDGSHDFAHLERVLANARALSALESAPPALSALVDAAALLHDMDDKKYGGDEAAQPRARAALAACGADAAFTERALAVVRGVSYTSEVARLAAGAGAGAPAAAPTDPDVELATALVQDADRLDAMGATGIARVFCFGGARGRPLAESVQHFHDKLLKLRDMFKTGAGRALAGERHDTMVQFLGTLGREWGAAV